MLDFLSGLIGKAKVAATDPDVQAFVADAIRAYRGDPAAAMRVLKVLAKRAKVRVAK